MSHHYNMKFQCQQYLNQPVHLQVNGQAGYSGVVEHVDDENVYIMVPVDETGQYMDLEQLMNGWVGQDAGHAFSQHVQQPMARQGENDRYYAPGYYPYYPYYSPYPYYPYPYGPYPRPIGWNRLILPLAALTAIAAIR